MSIFLKYFFKKEKRSNDSLKKYDRYQKMHNDASKTISIIGRSWALNLILSVIAIVQVERSLFLFSIFTLITSHFVLDNVLNLYKIKLALKKLESIGSNTNVKEYKIQTVIANIKFLVLCLSTILVMFYLCPIYILYGIRNIFYQLYL